MIETIEKGPGTRTERRRQAVGEVVKGVEADGFPGLTKTMYRMIGDNQPSIDCIKAADDAFGSASTAEDVWDAALGMAACLRNAELEPVEPDPVDPTDPHPDPPPHPFDLKDNVADIILAGLLVRARR